jgi:ABC-type transporter MlaC component
METSKFIKKSKKVFLASFLILIAAATTVIANSQTPLEVIRKSNGDVKKIFTVHKTIDAKIEEQLYSIIDGVTDFKTISRKVITRFCKKLTKQQCETFDRVFRQLLRVSSIKKLGRYRADKFEYRGEERDGTNAVVKTIAYYKEDKAALDYHLELTDGKWKIVNYVLDDIDTVRNYKKQFMRLFAKKTFDQIIERLNKKIESYEKDNRN